MPSCQSRKSHCGDDTILRPSYLHNGISYTGKITSLYWIRAQFPFQKAIMYVQGGNGVYMEYLRRAVGVHSMKSFTSHCLAPGTESKDIKNPRIDKNSLLIRRNCCEESFLVWAHPIGDDITILYRHSMGKTIPITANDRVHTHQKSPISDLRYLHYSGVWSR